MIRAVIWPARRIALALFVLTALARPCAAAAGDGDVKFDPIPCPAFPSFREMDFSYTIGDRFGASGSELPVKVQSTNWTACPNPADCGNYLSSTHQERPLVGNETITRVSFSTRGKSPWQPGWPVSSG